MSTATANTARDLDADLNAIQMAKAEFGVGGEPALINVITFTGFALIAWPYAIRRAQEAERENDKLREEINMLQEQLQQHRSPCYD